MSGNRRNNPADMTIVEQLESIREQMCDKYCHFRLTYMFQSDLEEKCEQCPLNRLGVKTDEAICESYKR